MQMREFIGTKKFYLAVIAIALPVMLQQFVASFVNLIDNVMIGNINTISLSGVTVANKIYSIYNSLLFGLCGATSIFIAQYFGAKEYHKCQKVLDINLIAVTSIGFLYCLLLVLIPEPIIRFFSTDPQVIEIALKYLRIAIFSYIPFGISFAVLSSLRATGINKIQLLVGFIGVITNTSLNYILIFGHLGFPVLGVEGAAIATVIARVLEMIIYLYIIVRKKYLFSLNLRNMINIDLSLIKSILKKALPLTFNEILYSLGISMIFICYVRCDESLIASVSVVDTTMQIAYIIFSGLASAVSIMIGKCLGANEIDTAKKNAKYLIVFGMFVGLCIGMIFICVSPLIAHMYNVEPVIKETIIGLIRVRCTLLPIYVFNVTTFFILRAGGDTLSTMIMDSGTLWCLNVTIGTLLSMFVPMPLITLSWCIESLDLVKMFISSYFLRKGKWAKNMTV